MLSNPRSIISIPEANKNYTNQNATWNFWFKVASGIETTEWMRFLKHSTFAKSNSNIYDFFSNFEILINSKGLIKFIDNVDTFELQTSISDKDWHLISFIFTFNGGVKILLDGIELGNTPLFKTQVVGNNTNYKTLLEIGGCQGFFDDFSFFDGALSTEQVKALFLSTKSKFSTFSVSQNSVIPIFTPNSSTVQASGGIIATSLSLPAYVNWTATSNATWLKLNSSSNGTGTSMLSFSVDSNPTVYSRSGAVSIAGTSFSVNQTGLNASVSPLSFIIPREGGSGTVGVNAESNGQWQAVSDSPWLTVATGQSGAGIGNCLFVVDPFSSTTASRSGTLSVAGKKVVITQRGFNLSLAASAGQVGGATSAAQVGVTAPNGAVWQAIATENWITLGNNGTGVGTGNLTYSFAENTTGVPRVGKIIVAGEEFTVSQSADYIPPSINISNLSDGAIFNKSTILINGTVSEDTSGAVAMEYRIGSAGQWIPVVVSGTASPFSWSQNLTLANGQNAIQFRAKDAVGNTSPVVSRNITFSRQTINFPVLQNPIMGTPATLNAVASSLLPVSYRVVSGLATITGNLVTFTGSGNVVLAANQAGNAEYDPAQEVTSAFFVNKPSQSIASFSSIAPKTFGDQPFVISPPVTTSGLPAIISVKSGPATISANNTITLTGAGVVTLAANQAGSNDYAAAAEVTTSFTVNKASQTIGVFSGIDPKIFSVTPFAVVSPSVNSGLTPSLTVKSGPATIVGNTVTLTGIGTVVLAANQVGNNNYNPAAEVTTGFVVSKATQSISIPTISSQVYGASFSINAISSSGSAVTYRVVSGPAAVSGNIVTTTGVGSVTIAANQAGNQNYESAPEALSTFSVVKANQTIATLPTIPDKILGASPFLVSAPLASSGLPVKLTIKSGPATISGNSITINGIGSVILAANQEGNQNYNPAPEVIGSFGVTAGKRVESWGYDSGYGLANVPNGLTDVIQVAAGEYHNLALKSDGTVVAWGNNNSGAINVPSAAKNITQISAGDAFSVALKSDGTVFCWGANSYGQCNVPAGLSGVIAISAGAYHVLALKSDGSVVGWGRSSEGQLSIPAGLRGVKQLAAGAWHSVALKNDGSVIAWGGTTYNLSTVPQGLSNVKQIAAGYYHTLALKEDGTLVQWSYSWGNVNYLPASLNSIIAIGSGHDHAIAIKSDGSSISWMPTDNTSLPSHLINAVNGISQIDGGASHNIVLISAKAPQVISAFSLIPTKKLGDSDFNISAPTASSGLPVELSVKSGPASITGNRIVLTGAGTVVLAAKQVGNTDYGAAPEVTTSFIVTKASQTILPFSVIPAKSFGASPFTVGAPSASSSLPVAISVKSGPATISGNAITLTGAGTVVLAANQGGNTDYDAAPEVTTNFIANKASQTISAFTAIPAKVFGASPFNVNAPSSSSSLPVGLSVKSGPASISGNTITLTGTGTVVLAANQPGNADFQAAPEVTTSFTVVGASQTISGFTAIPAKSFGTSPFNLSAPSSNSNLPVALSVKSGPATITGNTVTLTGVGTVVLAANQAGNADFGPASEVTTSFVVNKGSQTIGAFAPLGGKTFGSAFSVIPPTASSGLPVVLSVKSGPATISANNTVTPSGLGAVVLAANQAGDANYNAAPEVTTSFVVTAPPVPSAVITESKAEFWMPVVKIDEEWMWGIRPEGELEYQWTVELPCLLANYDVGYTKWKGAGEMQQNGTFNQLLAAGQVDVWKVSAGEASVLPDRAIRAYRKDQGLMIELTDAATLAELRSASPYSLKMKMVNSGVGEDTSLTVPVEYQKQAGGSSSNGSGSVPSAAVGGAPVSPASGGQVQSPKKGKKAPAKKSGSKKKPAAKKVPAKKAPAKKAKKK